MSDVRYTEDHEWIRLDGGEAVVGITQHAQDQLGDIVFIELPEVGKKVKKGDEAAVIESVKAAAEIYAPLDGEVVAVNQGLADEPALANTDPEGAGWIMRLRLADPASVAALMDAAAYSAFCEAQS